MATFTSESRLYEHNVLTLYPANSRVGRVSLKLKDSTPHFMYKKYNKYFVDLEIVLFFQNILASNLARIADVTENGSNSERKGRNDG